VELRPLSRWRRDAPLNPGPKIGEAMIELLERQKRLTTNSVEATLRSSSFVAKCN